MLRNCFRKSKLCLPPEKRREKKKVAAELHLHSDQRAQYASQAKQEWRR